jgi:hypothetical protein
MAKTLLSMPDLRYRALENNWSLCVVRGHRRCQHRGSRRTPRPKRFAPRLRSDAGLTARSRGRVIPIIWMSARPSCDSDNGQ